VSACLLSYEHSSTVRLGGTNLRQYSAQSIDCSHLWSFGRRFSFGYWLFLNPSMRYPRPCGHASFTHQTTACCHMAQIQRYLSRLVKRHLVEYIGEQVVGNDGEQGSAALENGAGQGAEMVPDWQRTLVDRAGR
jgi:hypothetical protein